MIHVAAAAAQAMAILIGPMSRYVNLPCCDNLSYTDNFGKEEYNEDILGALEKHKRILESLPVVSWLNSCLLCGTSLVSPGFTALNHRKTSCGVPLWACDRIHLSRAGCRELAAANKRQPAAERKTRTAQPVRWQIRRRLESVVTIPLSNRSAAPIRGVRPPGPPPTTCWLTGRAGHAMAVRAPGTWWGGGGLSRSAHSSAFGAAPKAGAWTGAVAGRKYQD